MARGKTSNGANKAAERFEEIRAGREDPCGRRIIGVYWSTENYAVYQWERMVPRRFRWLPARRERGVSPHFGAPEQRRLYAEISCHLSRIYALQRGRLAQREAVNRDIARAVALTFEGCGDLAKELLVNLRSRLVTMRAIEGRAWYLAACALLVLPLLTSLAGCFRDQVGAVLGGDPLLLKVVACGALGAFLSVLLGIRQLDIDAETPRQINAVFGATRMVIGGAAGLIVYLAVLSDFLAGIVAMPDESGAGVLLLAIVAGFSESFVPNILHKVGGGPGGSGKRRPART